MKTSLAVVTSLLAFWFCFSWKRAVEPVCDGKTLTTWLNQLDREGKRGGGYTIQVPSAEAIHKIGSNAIPQLIALLSYKAPAWKPLFIRWTGRQRFLGIDFDTWKLEEEKHRKAVHGFWALGPNQCAVKPLTSLCQSPDPGVRQRALDVLGSFDYDDERAVAAMIHCLNDPDADVRVQAARALKNFDSGIKNRDWNTDRTRPKTKASAAVSGLLEALQDGDMRVRSAAGAALEQIDSEALRKLKR